MGLPPSCAAVDLLRDACPTPPLLEVQKRAQRCVRTGQAGESGILAAVNMISQGPLGPALSQTDVDCIDGLAALLLNSLRGAGTLLITVLASASVLKTANSGEVGPRRPQNRVCGPNTEAPQTVVKAHELSGSALLDSVGAQQSPLAN